MVGSLGEKEGLQDAIESEKARNTTAGLKGRQRGSRGRERPSGKKTCPRSNPLHWLALRSATACIPFPNWWWVQALFCIWLNQSREPESIKGEAKREGGHSFATGPPSCLKGVPETCTPSIHCVYYVCNASSACLSCNWAVASMLFPIFFITREEQREENKPTWHYHS